MEVENNIKMMIKAYLFIEVLDLNLKFSNKLKKTTKLIKFITGLYFKVLQKIKI